MENKNSLDFKSISKGKPLSFVFDFSVIVNIKSDSQLDEIRDYILNNEAALCVAAGFYEDVDVVTKSSNEEQHRIMDSVVSFINDLSKKNKYFFYRNVYNSKEVVSKLGTHSDVVFLYAKDSVFAMDVCSFKGELNCSACIVSKNGEIELFTNSADILKNSVSKIDESVIDNAYYNIKFEPSEGATIRTRDGKNIILGKLIAKGGEGSVFALEGNKDDVVKIYHKGQLNKLRLQKMLLMEKKQIDYEGICWPRQIVFSPAKEPIGFIMKRMNGKSTDFVFDGVESLLMHFPDITRRDVVQICIDVLSKIHYLHLFGVILGDVRMKNIMINKDKTVSLVDLDSCQIYEYPCPAGFPDFTPAELHKVMLTEQLRTFDNESFALSVLMFKILFCGIHPYDRINGADTIEEEISLKCFPYALGKFANLNSIPVGGYKYLWKTTPHQFQIFLNDMFKSDIRFSDAEMIMMLKTYAQFLDLNSDKTRLNKFKEN